MEVVEISANFDPSVEAYLDQVSSTLDDVYEETPLVCQLQTEFVEYADLNFRNACRQWRHC